MNNNSKLSNNDLAVLITARLKSKRLKSKALLKIGAYNLITHLIKRLKIVFKSENIVLITSVSKKDLPLKKIAKNEKINFFAGDKNDVLLRMYNAAIKYKLKNFISCTADNPFVDPYIAKKMLKFHINNNYDMTTTDKLPIGVYSYAVNTNALSKIIKIKRTKYTEIWGVYFTKLKIFKCGNYKEIPKKFQNKKIRLTIDEKYDLELVRKIIKFSKSKIPSLDKIFKILKINNQLFKINSQVKQKKASEIKIKKQFNHLLK